MTTPSRPRPPKIADSASTASAVVASGIVNPKVVATPVTDPVVLDQGRVFAEALHQTQPVAAPGTSEAVILAKTLREGSARSHGIAQSTAERYAASPRTLDSLISGANPQGKAAEVVATTDYRVLHDGFDPGIVNPPQHVAANVADIRLSPDPAGRKDLLYAFETNKGGILWKYDGQIKTGDPQYVADSLVKMARTPGYGKVGYVDARLVNADGTPRVGPGAFTESQARQLQEAKVRLRGIPDLEERANRLMTDIRASKADGLDPVARAELQRLRDDIARAYQARGIAGRIGGGAAIAAASAAVVSLVVQLATEGRVDAVAVGHAAGTGAAFGAGGAAADAGLYHLATKAVGMTPEAAKAFAQQGVAVGFCVVAIGTDLVSEVRAARRGEVSAVGALGGTSVKTALDLLPLVMAPMGLAGLPILVGAQVGGRWLVARAREADRILEQAIAEDEAHAEDMMQRMSDFTRDVEEITAECSEATARFREVMDSATPQPPPVLRLVKV